MNIKHTVSTRASVYLAHTKATMDRRQRLISRILCVLMISATLSPTIHAATLADGLSDQIALPSISELRDRLDRTASDDRLTEEERDNRISELERAANQLEVIESFRKQIADYKESRAQAPERRDDLQRALASPANSDLPTSLNLLALEDLQAFYTSESLSLAELRSKLSTIDQRLNSESGFDVEKALSEARSIDQGSTSLMSETDIRMVASINAELQRLRVEMLEQRRLGKESRVELLKLEQQVLTQKAAATKSRADRALELIGDHQLYDAQEELKQAQQAFDTVVDTEGRQASIATENMSLADQLIDVVREQGQISKEAAREAQSARALEERFESLSTQLQLFRIGSSHEFGAALRKQRDQLASIDDAISKQAQFERQLANYRLAQFRHDNQKSEFESSGFVQYRPTRDTGEQEAIEQRARLIRKLDVAYVGLIDDLSQAVQVSQNQIERGETYANLLDQHLLWIRSAEAIGPQTLTTAGRAVAELRAAAIPSQAVTSAANNFSAFLLLGSFIALLLAGLAKYREQLLSQLEAMTTVVGKVHRDSFSVTTRALGITFLLALPGPLVLLGLSAPCLVGEGPIQAVGYSLVYGAAVYLALSLIFQTARHNGLGELHFKWPPEVAHTLRRNLAWFMVPFVVAITGNFFLEQFGSASVHDSLGRGAFILATLLLAVFAYRTLNPSGGLLRLGNEQSSVGSSWQVKFFMFPLIVLLPSAVAILSLFGYHYSAVQLDAHLLRSTIVVLIGVGIYFLVARASSISERRLALERIKAKRAAALTDVEDREAALAAGEGLPSAIDLQEIDIQAISDQTKVLIKLVVMLGVGFAFWQIWSDLLPAFQSLERVKLWDVSEVVDGIPIASSVTLWDLSLAGFAGLVTFLGARNIPGSLEVAILSRMDLDTGTSYAVTTMTRYLILIIGSVVVLQYLGAQWSKLQWLIAALSVGLGFGLQEIVANFVSGIVILFERPIRIGDTVSVGDQMGTVSQIQIRATTIVDWDRREVIIPNKTFITERLVNWTLTDPITRVIVPVGVAYGSDVDLVEELLLKVAGDIDLVLEDPPSVALFLNFGESSLDFELRMFVQGVRDIVLVKNQAHHAIARAFDDAGIDISFPQRDLHLDSKPLEVQLLPSRDEQTGGRG